MKANDPDWDDAQMLADIQAIGAIGRGSILAAYWRGALTFETQNHRVFAALKMLEAGTSGTPLALRFSATDASPALNTLLPQLERDQDFNPRAGISWTMSKVLKLLYGALTPLPDTAPVLRRAMPQIQELSPELALIASLALEDDLQADAQLLMIAQRTPGPLRHEQVEIALAAEAYHMRLCALVEAFGPCFGSSKVAELALERPLQDMPSWRAFAKRAVETASAAGRAVARGNVPYAADKLLPLTDAWVVAEAMQHGLQDRAPWAMERYEILLQDAALAPDPKVKSVPSQSLAIRLGHAAVQQVQPEVVLALRRVAAKVRHKGVKKKLVLDLALAEKALAQHPERLLELCTTGEMDPSFAKLLGKALEGLLPALWWFDAAAWAQAFAAPDFKKAARNLIWEVATTAGDCFTARPVHDDGPGWSRPDGSVQPFGAGDRLRLWHPAEASSATVLAWQGQLVETKAVQPFAQAFRETYRLDTAAGLLNETTLFAGIEVAAVPLLGLGRRIGWLGAGGNGRTLVHRLNGRRFTFEVGMATYIGAGGQGVTGALRLDGPEQSFAELPDRLISEVLRSVDLLVAVGAAGVGDRLHEKTAQHNADHVGTRSIEMRTRLLSLLNPGAEVTGRWLLLRDDAQLHLGTGQLFRQGALQTDAPPGKARASLRGRDVVLDRALQAIKTYGLR